MSESLHGLFDDMFDEGHIEQIKLDDRALLESVVTGIEAGGGMLTFKDEELSVFSMRVEFTGGTTKLLLFHDHLARALLMHLFSYGSHRGAAILKSEEEEE